MKCIAISEAKNFKLGDEVCELPREVGSVLALRNTPPYFQHKQHSVYHEKLEDIAFIEWKIDKYIISPSLSSRVDRNASDTVFVNGVQVQQPMELWPGSRLALSHSHHIFFVLPDPEFKQNIQDLIYSTAKLTYLSLLKRRVLLTYHHEQQSLRVLKIDQQLARLDREAEALKKQAKALFAKKDHIDKKVFGIRKEADMVVSPNIVKARAANNMEQLVEMKQKLMELKSEGNELELAGNEAKKEGERCKQEELKMRDEYEKLSVDRTEMQRRVLNVENWLKLCPRSLKFAKEHMKKEDKKTIPSKKDILDQYFPHRGGDIDIDEQPITDAVFSNPKAREQQRYLLHLLSLPPLLCELEHLMKETQREPTETITTEMNRGRNALTMVNEDPTHQQESDQPLLLEPQSSKSELLAIGNSTRPMDSASSALTTHQSSKDQPSSSNSLDNQDVSLASSSSDFMSASVQKEVSQPKPSLCLYVALKELTNSRPMDYPEMKQTVKDHTELIATREQQIDILMSTPLFPKQKAIYPFKVKQRVVFYDEATGVWVTSKVLSCSFHLVEVECEETKRVFIKPVSAVRDWQEHLRSTPHLWKLWKGRGARSTHDVRDRAPVLGFLICNHESKQRRLDWYNLMLPKFEKHIKKDPLYLKVLARYGKTRRPWSHRNDTWRDPTYFVKKPRLPTSKDKKLAWISSRAPVTLEETADYLKQEAAYAKHVKTLDRLLKKQSQPKQSKKILNKDTDAYEKHLFGSEDDVSESEDSDYTSSEDSLDSEEDNERRKSTTSQDYYEQRRITDEKIAAIKKQHQARDKEHELKVEAAQQKLKFFSRFDGNEAALTELNRISSKGMPRHVLIHGADGSGKQSCVSLLIRKTLNAQILKAEAGIDESQLSAGGVSTIPSEGPTNTGSVSSAEKLSHKINNLKTIMRNSNPDVEPKWATLFDKEMVIELSMETLKSGNLLKNTIASFTKKPLPPKLYSRLMRAAHAKGLKKAASLTRFIIVRNFEKVPPSLQMVLVQRFEEVEASNIRFIFMGQDISGVVGPLMANLLCISMKCLSIDHWLDRLLTVCVAEQVGYDREGIKLVVELANNDFGAAIDLIQQCFIYKHFISTENVIQTVQKILKDIQTLKDEEAEQKKLNRSRLGSIPTNQETKKLVVLPEPRQIFDEARVTHKPTPLNELYSLGKSLRCSICTLPPPCKHISGKLLIDLARERIKQAKPNPGMPVCPSFVRTGACEAVTIYGYCRLDHPAHLYRYTAPPKRCPICTIPEPCNTCQWFFLRRAVAKLVSRASLEFIALKIKGQRATVSLSKFRSQYERDILQFEELLNENAKWLNCSDHTNVANHMTDKDLVTGKYSTNEAECRVRYDNLKQRYQLVIPRLSQWINGQDARPGTYQSSYTNDNDQDGKKTHSVTAIAEVATRRYMPSTIAAPLDANGYAEWEDMHEFVEESPVVIVNEKLLKMGLVDKHSSRKHTSSHKELTDRAVQEEKLRIVNEERKNRSVFGSSKKR